MAADKIQEAREIRGLPFTDSDYAAYAMDTSVPCTLPIAHQASPQSQKGFQEYRLSDCQAYCLMLYWLYWAFSTAITRQQSGRHTPVAVAPHSHCLTATTKNA